MSDKNEANPKMSESDKIIDGLGKINGELNEQRIRLTDFRVKLLGAFPEDPCDDKVQAEPDSFVEKVHFLLLRYQGITKEIKEEIDSIAKFR